MNDFQIRHLKHNNSFDANDPRENDVLHGKAIFDPENPGLKKEILGLIAEYLHSQDMTDSVTVLQEEGNILLTPHANFIQTASLTSSEFQQQHMIKNSLFNKSNFTSEGDWDEVEKLCLKYAFKNHKNFLFDVYKQKYFELLERQEYQTAYSHLVNKLKPLEAICSSHSEFSDLCYLLACKSIKEANLQTTDPEWDKASAREKLVSELESLLGLDTKPHSDHLSVRLLALIRQAVAFQIEVNHLYPKSAPTVKQLSENYHGLIVPNKLRQTLIGHTDNVKCVEFLGDDGNWIISGSSDNTLRLWPLHNRQNIKGCITLTGHNSRIWDVATTRNTNTVATASGDETIKIWKLNTSDGEQVVNCVSTLNGHKGDIYTIRFHPDQHHIVTGGYDKTVRLFDVTTGQMKRLFTGHNSSVSRAIFNPSGNLIISGSKDSTIKFWDIRSSVCVKTISSHLGEVTSIEINSSGTLLLSASKDNCNRLWETGTARPIVRFKGHQNTSKNFVRATFGADEALVIGGSEDGMIYIWDIETGSLLNTLAGHTGMVYATRWNHKKAMLASCSHDNTVKTWTYDPNMLSKAV